ncbi:MAG: gamma-glutamylcyclotransferase family protein, partial [Pseudomonadota bacterium]
MQDDQTRRSGVFLYGPFLAPELLALANPAAGPSGAASPARLPGWRLETSDDAAFPHLVEDAAHSVDGLFVACADPWQLPPLFSG